MHRKTRLNNQRRWVGSPVGRDSRRERMRRRRRPRRHRPAESVTNFSVQSILPSRAITKTKMFTLKASRHYGLGYGRYEILKKIAYDPIAHLYLPTSGEPGETVTKTMTLLKLRSREPPNSEKAAKDTATFPPQRSREMHSFLSELKKTES